jgi:MraZ protein
MFFGEFKHQLDAKNRCRVPAKLRGELGEKFVVTKGGSGCLFVFNEKRMEALNEKVANVPMFDRSVQEAVRKWFSSAADVENDDQGRFLLPQNLKDYAKIEKNIVVIGAGSRIEIWSEERWNDYNSGNLKVSAEENGFDEVLSQLSAFGV